MVKSLGGRGYSWATDYYYMWYPEVTASSADLWTKRTACDLKCSQWQLENFALVRF